MNLSVLEGKLAICRLAPEAALPTWGVGGDFWSITRTDDELSVVCREEGVPRDVRCERGWRALRLEGPFDFSEVGVLLPIAEVLAVAGISILPIATFDTDYVLVKEDRLPLALERLREAGHGVARE